MTGRHHVIANAALACVLVRATHSPVVADALLGPWSFAGLAVGVALCLVGALLPDADNPRSIVGRRVRIGGEHRTWTHAIWVPLLLLVLSRVSFLRPLAWLAVGWANHVALDAFSRAGVCWLWPFTDYLRYPSGAFCARGHRFKIYATGRESASERAFLVFVCVVYVFAFLLV